MTRPLLIIGAGGFGREVLGIVEAINAVAPTWSLEGFIDDQPGIENEKAVADLGSAIIGNVSSMTMRSPGRWAVVAVGSPSVRADIVTSLLGSGLLWATLVHPDTTVGPRVTVGEGCIIAPGARLSTNIRVGRHVHVDQNVTVGHDSTLGDFVRLNPQACVSGAVAVGQGALVGASATILQGLTVGAKAIIGAQACVTRNVADSTTVKGVPAR
jgi:sugar O-acyltransferase (sialic acid O-acetyltransferase NeuD family)